MDIIRNIERLSQLCGTSGDEGAVREEILRQLEGHCDCTVDPLGNLIAFRKGAARPKSKLLLSAHMDEVGFIITHVEDSGLLRFAAVGGIDSRVVVGKAVEVGAARLYGVIGVKALHQAENKERETPLKLEDLYIDIGAENREQAEAVVRPGDRAVFFAPFQRLGSGQSVPGGKIMGRAFDDRAGCAMLIELAASELPYDCTFAFTVQEETGCTGAVTAGYTVAPDIAVAVETTTASDIAGVSPDKVVCRLGAGPVVSFMDRGAIYDRELFRLALSTAKEKGIPAQAKEGVYGGNESRSLQTAGAGARALAVSLPCRYIHSPSNVLQVEDIENTVKLLRELVGQLGALSAPRAL